MSFEKGTVTNGRPVLEKRPEPGGHKGQAVGLAIQKELRMKRKGCPALGAELAKDTKSKRLSRRAAGEVLIVTAVVQ